MIRRTFLNRAGLALAAMHLPEFARGAERGGSRALPPFGWERVPAYGHVGKTADDFTSRELEFLARHFDLVAIEKMQATGRRGFTEDGIFEAARRLKALNPRMKILFYWNAFINYPKYRALERYKPQWDLKDTRGQVLVKSGGITRPDLSLPEVREWWSDVAAEAVRQGPLDGIFADALPQVFAPALARQVGGAKAQAVAAGLEVMLAMAKEKMGAEKMILANGLRGSQGRQLLEWDSIDGVIVEHFGHFQTASPADIKADLESLALAAKRGRFCIVKGWPGFDWLDTAQMRRPHDELLRVARERITFPLACYLAGACDQSWFAYSWGYRETHGTLDRYPELERPLGPPEGEARWQGLAGTRRFAHAVVHVDLEKRAGRIEWD